MAQMVPWLVFCLLVLGLALVLPRTARAFLGLFFVLMAVGVNWALSLVAPGLFVSLGTDAPLLAPYAWLFKNVIAVAPPVFGFLAGAGEIVLAVLMLSRGTAARLGLLGGAAFLLVITPLGIWTLPNPILAAALLVLARRRWPTTAWQDGKELLGRHRRSRGSATPTTGAR
jgi:hypothetical protein